MQKIIFITGGDRTGKSTLCEYFVKNGFKYMHFDPPKKSPYEEYLEFYRHIKTSSESTACNWIVDRYIWCEYAYSRHYSRKSDCSLSRIRALETKFLDFDSRLIYCETDLDSNWNRIISEGKNEFTTKADLEKLRIWYEQSFIDTVLPFYKYDFSVGMNPMNMYDKIMENN